ncbi:hypothetical protein [Nocardia salmonicida]|uniref:hypothetical protein n=1 Tax=Nocardia salmonicida TaxID=53431 RepID=UPI0037A0205F
MSTRGTGSAVADAQNRWSTFRRAGTLVVIGLYSVSLVRMVVSKDWGDLTATRLAGLAVAVAGLLVFADVLETIAVDRPRRRWTKLRTVAGLVVAGLILAGITTSIIRTGTVWGDPAGRLFTQMVMVGSMLFVIADRPAEMTKDPS